MKLNVDASWAAATGNGHAGVIARNDDGLFEAARKLKIKAPSAAAAEALAILYGCELASSMGMERIIVESDSKENFSCLLDASITGCWEAFPTLVKIMRFGESFQACC
ncbi:hypothetical protein C1H46_031311 [Malus baccata]|uniref:RNase H type-1 domain-containing protein n=1 Tax=Malus baccata TaxID=106549 RepID=A0A540L9Z6_MALBA|nr:hypothetical protein C1H46_031311 [Malus baccata]